MKKIVIIGGTSPSTPALFSYLAAITNLPRLEIVLLARSRAELGVVKRACLIVAKSSTVNVVSVSLADGGWAESLTDADVILLQARIGGYEGREYDETFPLTFDVCGDQDLGPGGFANAWRSWGHLKLFFEQAAARAPRSIFVVLSSPVSLLVRLGLRLVPALNITGICELPWSSLKRICSSASEVPSFVDYRYIGVHHFGWFYQLRVRNKDLIREYGSAVSTFRDFPPAALVRRFGAIPTPYARLHFESKAVIAEHKRDPGSRARYLREFRRRAFSVFELGTIEEIKAVLKERPSPWYSDAVGPFLQAAFGSTISVPLFLSRRNGVAPSGFKRDDILELAYEFYHGELRPVHSLESAPKIIIEALRPFLDADRVAAEAIWQNSPSLIRDALGIHPWTVGRPDVYSLLAQKITQSPRPESFSP
jgi:6-phospho-beta-glucosidase